jgi:hypothetical protein
MKKIKAWAIIPAFPYSKELQRFPFLTENRQLLLDEIEKAIKDSVEDISKTDCHILNVLTVKDQTIAEEIIRKRFSKLLKS